PGRDGGRGAGAGGARRGTRPAALRLPEPPLGQRLPHAEEAGRRRRARRRVPLRVPLRALASAAQGRLAGVGRPGGDRRPALRPRQPCRRPGAGAVRPGHVRLRGVGRPPGGRAGRRRHVHRADARERGPLPPPRLRDDRPARPALPRPRLEGGLRQARPRPPGGGPPGRAAAGPGRGRLGHGGGGAVGPGRRRRVPGDRGRTRRSDPARRLPRLLHGGGAGPAGRRPQPGDRPGGGRRPRRPGGGPPLRRREGDGDPVTTTDTTPTGTTPTGTTPPGEELEARGRRRAFRRFPHVYAWGLGSLLVRRARERHAPVAIDIHRGGQQLFHAALPGSAPDNDAWIAGKRRVVQRYGSASYLVGARHRAKGTTFEESSRLDPDTYAAHGGSFPITV